MMITTEWVVEAGLEGVVAAEVLSYPRDDMGRMRRDGGVQRGERNTGKKTMATLQPATLAFGYASLNVPVC
jgi:hypothetical protein